MTNFSLRPRTVTATVGRLGVDGFWVRDYGGGGPGKPPCWRTLEESCKGLGSVSLKNKQPTHTLSRFQTPSQGLRNTVRVYYCSFNIKLMWPRSASGARSQARASPPRTCRVMKVRAATSSWRRGGCYSESAQSTVLQFSATLTEANT